MGHWTKGVSSLSGQLGGVRTLFRHLFNKSCLMKMNYQIMKFVLTRSCFIYTTWPLFDSVYPSVHHNVANQLFKHDHFTVPEQVVISINDTLRTEQATDKIWISYKKLFNTVTEGAVILLDDGAIEVTLAAVLDKAPLLSASTIKDLCRSIRFSQ